MRHQADTKLAETLFLREQIVQNGSCGVLLLNVGSTPVQHRDIDVSYTDLAANALSNLPRAEYIKETIPRVTADVRSLYTSGQIHGIITAGGSSGTALATAVMREALPVGFPKLMVSTMASGDVKSFVEETDITLMYSVVDIAGANSILGKILANTAEAIVGATVAYHNRNSKDSNLDAKSKRRVGITMFGVTTPCVDAIRSHIEGKYPDEYEVYVFRATGAGGKAMERLVRERQLDAVLDVTTTEIADELVGGVLSAGPDRLTAAAKAGIPQVISVGACDMVNFGPRDTVPATFVQSNRRLHEHNPAVTLMRTSPEECTCIADFIASKLRAHASRPDLVRVLLPTGGVSMISTPGKPFHDPEADSALFVGLEKRLEGSGIEVRRDDRAINDVEFAVLAAESLVELIRRSEANTI